MNRSRPGSPARRGSVGGCEGEQPREPVVDTLEPPCSRRPVLRLTRAGETLRSDMDVPAPCGLDRWVIRGAWLPGRTFTGPDDFNTQ